MPSRITVDVPDAPAVVAEAPVTADASVAPPPSASAPPPQPPAPEPIAIDDDDDDDATDTEVQVESVAEPAVATARASKTTKKKTKKTGGTKKSNAKSSQGTSSNDAATANAKTVTPKKEGKKKAGRPKKKNKDELPPNQRTLGAFFGAPAKKKSTAATGKAKAKPASADKDTSADKDSSQVESEESTAAAGENKEKSAANKKTAAAAKKATATKKSTPKKKAKAKSTSSGSSSTVPPPSDEIKAIVLESAYKKQSSSSNTPLPKLDITKGIASIPSGVIQSQRQIRLQEEEEEKKKKQQDKAEEDSKEEEGGEEGQPPKDQPKGQQDKGDAALALPSTSFVSPAPAAKKRTKKAKKRAALIPVTAAAPAKAGAPANYGSKPSPNEGSNKASVDADESSHLKRPAMELDDEAATVEVDVTTLPSSAAAVAQDNEDGESLHSDEDDVMSIDEDGEEEPAEHLDIDINPTVNDDADADGSNNDQDDDDDATDDDAADDDNMEIVLTDTAAKGSAVEGSKVLDLTLGEDTSATSSDADETTSRGNRSGDGTPPAAGNVSKRLSFTPKKTVSTASAAAPARAGKATVKIGGLDAFAVPISSIKGSKKSKKTTTTKTPSSAQKEGGSSYVNKRIAKEFDDGIVYRGTITRYTDDGSADGLWHIAYDDGDEEKFSLVELEAGLKLFESEAKKAPDEKEAKPAAAAAPIQVEPELPEEFKTILAKNETLRKRYRKRAEDLVIRSTELVEEDFDRTVTPKEGQDDATTAASPEDGTFPEVLLQELAVLIQGSPLPLSTVTTNALAELAKLSAGKRLTADIVSAKIKIMAARKQYLTTLVPSTIQADKFEDTQAELVWRWELTTLDLLPTDLIPKAKKAQAGRRMLQNFHKAVVKLLASLDKADTLFLNAKSPKNKRDTALAKISTDEDKVLKYEREEEKQRLARETKAQKEALKEQAKLQKEQEKKLAAEKKEQEKKLAAEKKDQEKKLAAAKREEEREVGILCMYDFVAPIRRISIRDFFFASSIIYPTALSLRTSNSARSRRRPRPRKRPSAKRRKKRLKRSARQRRRKKNKRLE